MPKHLQNDLEKLKKKLFELCAMVEENMMFAIKSLTDKDIKQAERAQERDVDINNMEIEVEEDCLKIFALYQPVAIDLRFIVSVLKINYDLERIGDLAANIAKRSIHVISINNPVPDFNFTNMYEKSMKMLKNSLDALVEFNTEKANDVIKSDDEIDDLNRQMFDVFKVEVIKNPQSVEFMLQYLSISRHLERIADHAVNISEDIIYMIDGEIVRHKKSN